ncbi:MAG: hypothetical protein AAB804_01075 [Patescibacteria group bacterium]
MNLDSIAPLIIEYRYWILVPLSIVEGPIVAFIAGTLAATGYFNIYALAAFFFVRDMIMDALYYALGHFGGRTSLAQRLLHRIGVRQNHLEEVRTLWERHAGVTMFLGKLSYGIASSFIVVAGMVRMPLGKFFGWGALAAIAQYGVLLLLGYFFGNTLGGEAVLVLERAQYVLAAVALVATIYYIGSRYARKRLMSETSHHE